ncbi:MAG: hypothetical protein NXI31_13275 [bacterium]|nr:hypothetical protein [bacterium]
MVVRSLSASLLFAPLVAALPISLAAQDPASQDPANTKSAGQAEAPHVAYPERDALTPFRAPAEVYAPPDKLYSLLRRMRAMASSPRFEKRTDSKGREIVADPTWQDLHDEVAKIGLDAGYLASIMRQSKNADDRRTAYYAMFYCDRVDYVLNLISHIPGEPVQQTRQEAFPRAAKYLAAHLGRRFGDLDDERKAEIVANMPEPGSPAAKTAGIVRAPRDSDHLHPFRVVPFIQLLNERPIDQAQALWFLNEVFKLREDLAVTWLEPALPRLMQLVRSDNRDVQQQTITILRTVGGKELRSPPAVSEAAALMQWAEDATKRMFPPIRNVNNALIELYPSEELDAIVAAGIAALENSSIGDPFVERQDNGQYLRGFRVARVPEALEPLAIPVGAVITAVNGAGIANAKTLLATTKMFLEARGRPQKLLVEYSLKGKTHAVEYRVR